jgi:hypothetical protein
MLANRQLISLGAHAYPCVRIPLFQIFPRVVAMHVTLQLIAKLAHTAPDIAHPVSITDSPITAFVMQDLVQKENT